MTQPWPVTGCDMGNYSVIFITVLLTQTMTKKKKKMLDSDMVHSVCVMNNNRGDGYANEPVFTGNWSTWNSDTTILHPTSKTTVNCQQTEKKKA